MKYIKTFEGINHNVIYPNGGSSENVLIRDIFNALIGRNSNQLQKLINADNIDILIFDKTPLMHCAFNHDFWTAKMLIAWGADVDYQNTDDETALHIAARYNSDDITELLLRFSANVNIKNNKDQRPIDIAIGYGYIEIVKMLKNKGSFISLVELGKQFSHAITDGQDKMVKFMLDYGVDVNLAPSLALVVDIMNSDTYKHSEYFNILKQLISYGIDVNKKTNVNSMVRTTPLLLTKFPEVAELLIDAGGDVNEKDSSKNTPLILAAQKERMYIIEILIKNGANWNALNDDGKSFIDYLKYNDIEKLKKSYPEKYEEYLDVIELEKTSNKYNL